MKIFGGDLKKVPPLLKRNGSFTFTLFKHFYYRRYEADGQCHTGDYIPWMRQNCEESCRGCSGCWDYKIDCEFWEKNDGSCTNPKWATFMEKNCPLTCGKCAKPKNSCRDYNSQCRYHSRFIIYKSLNLFKLGIFLILTFR